MKQKQLIRERFRNDVFARDKFTCQPCLQLEGEDFDIKPLPPEQLDAHHITDRNEMPGGGYVKENGITVCARHHQLAEIFHTTGGKEWPHMFHPDDLYKMIGSSYAHAVATSKRKLT